LHYIFLSYFFVYYLLAIPGFNKDVNPTIIKDIIIVKYVICLCLPVNILHPYINALTNDIQNHNPKLAFQSGPIVKIG